MASSLIDNTDNVTQSEQPVFIVGAPRSGTTLTATILGQHSRIFMPGETHFFPDIYSRHQSIGEPTSKDAKKIILARLRTLYERYNEPADQARIDRLMSDSGYTTAFWQSCHTYKSIFSWFMETQMRFEGKQRWGNQVPKDIFHIDQILSFYPNAKIIVCVRDVHDFLLSYKYKWRATTQDHVKRIQSLYHPVLTSLIWKSSARKIKGIESQIPSDNLYLLRYEHLVTMPDTVVPALCQFLGETFEPDMLNINSHNSSKNVSETTIFNTSVGRWKKELSAVEAAVADIVCGSEMTAMGYEKSTTPVRYRDILWSFATLPQGLIRALNANKASSGPILPYLSRRISALWR